MTFWIVSGGLAVLVATLIALALRAPKRGIAEPAAAYDLRVYRDQLREVEKDLARGVVEQADAERVRAEISRRILAADAAMQQEALEADAARGAPVLVAGVVAAGLVGGSLALYGSLGAPGYGDLALASRVELAAQARENRPSQQQAEDSLPAYVAPAGVSPDYVALVERLRATVANRPNDIQGHLLLAQNEANLGNFRAAARAQSQVIRIKGDAATVDDYIGLMMAQTGRPDTAFRLWDQLLREGPSDAPWIEPILAQIEEMAFRAGVNYQVPDIGPGRDAPRGPTSDDVEAAQNMTPAQRMEMIQNMVSGLSDRLATEGGPVQDWAQLITALGVLGQTQQARAIYDNAVEVFADDTRALDLLLRAGQRAQVVE